MKEIKERSQSSFVRSTRNVLTMALVGLACAWALPMVLHAATFDWSGSSPAFDEGGVAYVPYGSTFTPSVVASDLTVNSEYNNVLSMASSRYTVPSGPPPIVGPGPTLGPISKTWTADLAEGQSSITISVDVIGDVGGSDSRTVIPVLVIFSLKASGNLSDDDYLGTNSTVVALFGPDPSLGGPKVANYTPPTISYLVEIKGSIQSSAPPPSDFTLSQTIQHIITVYFSDDSHIGPQAGGAGPDSGVGGVQAGPGQVLYTLDGPGPGRDAIFAYFGSTPPTIPGQPSGTTVASIVWHDELVTTANYNGSACGHLSWFVEYTITGGSMDDVAGSTGAH
jgi:hypothetical protein